MNRELTTKQYELAYHIVPDIEEAALERQVQDIEGLISQQSGSIVTSQKPKKVHLSYPIRHFHYAHFGVINFNGPTDIVQNLTTQMKLQGSILRYLILSKDLNDKDLRILGHQKAHTRTRPVAPADTTAKATPASPEKTTIMEKELDSVLGKI